MTTDPYADAGSATFGPGGQAPVAPGYGISDPFTTTSSTGASAVGGGTSGSTSGSNPTVDTAKDQAGQVKDTATGAAQQVAGTAKEEAGNVVGEAKAQASNLLDQVKGEAGSQVSTQQQRLAGMVSSYAKELGSMASGSDESGPLTDLAHQASKKVGEAAHWLENREPSDLLDEVRTFARRRPGAFLLSALAAGVVVGRLTRGAVDDARSDDTPAITSSRVSDVPAAPVAYSDPLDYDGQAVPGYETEPVGGYGQTTVGGSDLTDPYSTTTYGDSTYGTPGQVR